MLPFSPCKIVRIEPIGLGENERLGRDIVDPDDTHDLFDQVLTVGDIVAKTRHDHDKVIFARLGNIEAEIRKNPRHAPFVDGRTDNLRHILVFQPDGRRLEIFGMFEFASVDSAALARFEQTQQHADTDRKFRFAAARRAVKQRTGFDLVRTHLARDHLGIDIARLDNNGARRILRPGFVFLSDTDNRCPFPAENTGESFRVFFHDDCRFVGTLLHKEIDRIGP